MNVRSTVGTMLLVYFCLCASSAFAADTITGTVHNQTTSRPSAGDDVVLLRLAEGMQEEARTKTDAQGAFLLQVNFAKSQHVVRVLHAGVNYDRTVIGNGPLEIKVFDAVPKIPGLNGNMGIVRMESDGSLLKVTEMYSITNASTPPVTQSGPRNFEIFLPGKATFDSVEAKAPDGIWVNVPPVAQKAQPGRYAISFPLRPGDTLFKFAYHLPSQASNAFHLKLAYPIKNFAVMHPPSMSFKASRSGAFANPGMAGGLQVEQAVTKTFVSQVPAFEISGVGVAPPREPRASAAQTKAPPVAASSTATTNNPAVDPGLNPGSAKTGQSAKEVWLILAGISLVLAAGVFTLWRRRQKLVPAVQAKESGDGQPLLAALKEELFQLETDRMRGSVSLEEYTATKQALGLTLQRAMKKDKT